MRLDTLNVRIANAKSKIEKKNNTIAKKTELIKKKTAKLVKLGADPEADKFQYRDNNDIFWTMCEIETLKEDIERGTNEIEETKASLAKYEAQLAGELEKESIILKEIPESMKRMQTELVERWDAWDIERRDQIKADRATMNYEAYCKKYSASDRYDFVYKTNEKIHKDNMQDAKLFILNMF